MNIWLVAGLMQAQTALQVLTQTKKLKLSKDEKELLAGIRDLITSLIGK